MAMSAAVACAEDAAPDSPGTDAGGKAPGAPPAIPTPVEPVICACLPIEDIDPTDAIAHRGRAHGRSRRPLLLPVAELRHA